MAHLIFNRMSLDQFWVVRGAKTDKEAWEIVRKKAASHRNNPTDIGLFPPEAGDDFDLIDVEIIEAD